MSDDELRIAQGHITHLEERLQVAQGHIAYLEEYRREQEIALATSESLVLSHEGHIARLQGQIQRLEQESQKISFVATQIPLDLDVETLRKALIRAIHRQTKAEDQMQFCSQVTDEIQNSIGGFTGQLAEISKKISDKIGA